MAFNNVELVSEWTCKAEITRMGTGKFGRTVSRTDDASLTGSPQPCCKVRVRLQEHHCFCMMARRCERRIGRV